MEEKIKTVVSDIEMEKPKAREIKRGNTMIFKHNKRRWRDKSKWKHVGSLLYIHAVISHKYNEDGKFIGYHAEITNRKTKESFNTDDLGLTFKTCREGKEWAETYAYITYYEIYNEYKGWIQEKLPNPDNPNMYISVYHPPTEEEWKECKEREKEWVDEFKNKFKHNKIWLIREKYKDRREQLIQESLEKKRKEKEMRDKEKGINDKEGKDHEME